MNQQPTNNLIYDTIYIGSGPVHILDACAETLKGKEVLIIEERDKPCGAWQTVRIDPIGDVELGCHIWSYNKKVYKFIAEALNVQLDKMTPQPIIINGNSKLSYDHKMAIGVFKVCANLIKKRDFKGLVKFITQHPAARLPIIPKHYLYPNRGSKEFEEKLIQLLATNKVPVQLNSKSISVEYTNNTWKIAQENGTFLQTKNVQLTTHANLKNILVNQVKIPQVYHKTTFTHYHLIIKGKPAKPFSYIRIMKDPLIHRVSDISSQLSNLNTGVSVILVGVFSEKLNETLKPLESIREKLIELKLITEAQEIINYHSNTFSSQQMDASTREQLIRAIPSLRFTQTTDLIYGFHQHLARWKKEGLLGQDTK